MFGVDGFEPWTGVDGKYEGSTPRIMVLGEQQLDAPLTDRECILRKLGGAHDLIFNNFDQAVLGCRQWQDGYREQVRAFWERTVFYNYNVGHGLAKGGAKLSAGTRLDPLHPRLLRAMLRTYKPTHVIVWGDDNWRAITVEGSTWERDDRLRCGEIDEPGRKVVVDGHPTLFTRVTHPSASFAYERWSALLARFLALAA
jgi:hypothetical protein